MMCRHWFGAVQFAAVYFNERLVPDKLSFSFTNIKSIPNNGRIKIQSIF
jgi:hypothetical protein